MKFIYILLLGVILLAGCQQEDVLAVDKHLEVEEEVIMPEADESMDAEFVSFGNNYKGYLVKPMQEGKYPSVIMIHEWWGLNQNIKNMAHDLAEEGFLVLAVDLYDGKVAENSKDAGKYAGQVRDNMAEALSHLKSASDYLQNHEMATGKIASMGWCFGGGMSMQLALNDEVDATVIYYGSVETDQEKLQTINWPVLGIFGETDSVIPLNSVNQFEQVLDALGIENEIYIYEGLGHAFANPSNPGHDPKSTEDAWIKTVNFLNTHLE